MTTEEVRAQVIAAHEDVISGWVTEAIASQLQSVNDRLASARQAVTDLEAEKTALEPVESPAEEAAETPAEETAEEPVQG